MTNAEATNIELTGVPVAPSVPARIPPHDLAAERAILGGLLIDREAVFAVRDVLEPEDFYAERHTHIYRAAAALSDRGEPIDVLTLHAELERSPGGVGRAGGDDYLAELTLSVPTAASIAQYARIVIDHSLRRRLISAGSEVSRLGFDVSVSADAALDDAQQRVFTLGDQHRRAEARRIDDLVKETWELLEQRLQHKKLISGVQTNFSKLDNFTRGLQPGELIILAARPSVGKTSFALNIARNAAVLAKEQVAVFSLEMSKQSLVERLICSEAMVDSYLVRTGQADANAFQRIAKAMDTLTQANLWIDDTPALSINSLRTRARRMRAQHNIGLVVVDYLQLMQGGRSESRVQEVSEISSGLKSIAKELNIPILALSQLSRESERRESKRPQLSDLRDSGSIEQDADVVLFLYREGMHKPEIDKSDTELIIAKNRNGPVGEVPLVFVAEQTAFREPYPGGE